MEGEEERMGWCNWTSPQQLPSPAALHSQGRRRVKNHPQPGGVGPSLLTAST